MTQLTSILNTFGTKALGASRTCHAIGVILPCIKVKMLFPQHTEVAERDQLLNGPTLPMLWFQYPELCEFQLPGRPRRTKEGDLKVRTQRVVEGKQT